MGEADLVRAVATASGISDDVAQRALDAAFGEIRAACRRGESVTVAGFGRFESPDLGTPFVWFGSSGLLPREAGVDERGEWAAGADRVAAYLRANYDPEGFFGIGVDELPTVPKAHHPGVCEREDIRLAEETVKRWPSTRLIVAEILR